MKKVLPAAIIIAACAFIVIACKWFKTDAVHQPFSIVGSWKFEETRKNPGGFTFLADSMLTDLQGRDSTAYYVKDSTVFIKEEDSSFTPYHLNITNDSLISLTSKDSIVLVLKKQ